MDKENLRKIIEANLRSVTQSCKGGVPLQRLQKDYRDLLGSYIPFQDLGFSSLEAMLKDMSNVVRLQHDRLTNTANVLAVADETTVHLARLVANQRSTQRRALRARRNPILGRSAFGNRQASNYRARSAPSSRHWNSLDNSSRYQQPIRQSYVRTTQPPDMERRPTISPNACRQVRDHIGPRSGYDMPPRFRRQMEMNQSQERLPPPRRSPTPPSRSPTPPAQERLIPTPTPSTQPIRTPTPSSQTIGTPTPTTLPNRRVQYLENVGLKITIPPPAVPPSPDSDEAFVIPPPVPDSVPDGMPARTKRKKQPPLLPSPLLSPPMLNTAKEKLEYYAKRKGLVVEFKTKRIGQKVKNYVSSLKFGAKTYQIYPEVRETAAAAEEAVASLAVEDIEQEDKELKLPETDVSDDEKLNELMTRIQQIVISKKKGVWSVAIPKEYEADFSESLPANWLTLVEENLSSIIEVSVFDGISHPKGARILRVITASGAATPTSTTSTSSNLIEDDIRPSLYPESTQLPVVVSCVVNTSKIYVRPIEDKFVLLIEEMSKFYDDNVQTVDSVEDMMLYSARSSEELGYNWHRVRAERFDKDSKKVMCYFVDIGDTTEVSLTDLRELDPRFKHLPFQAICMQLAGLEDYAEFVRQEYLVNYLLDKSLIAEVLSREGTIVKAVLYDTSGEDDLNLNDFLLRSTFMESLISELPEEGSICIGFLLHASGSGEVYLNLNNPDLCLIETELEKLAPQFEAATLLSTSRPFPNNAYVTKHLDGLWYRSILVPSSEGSTPSDEVEMFFVDQGITTFVKPSDICELKPISSLLASLPSQAVPCLLTNVPKPGFHWTEAALQKLCELAPEHEELIIKVDERSDSDDIASKVTLCKRNSDADIVSINETLNFCQDPIFRRNSLGAAYGASSLLPLSPVEKPKSLDLSSTTVSLSSHIPDVVPSTAFDDKMSFNNPLSPPLLWDPTPDVGTPGLDAFSEKLSSPTADIPPVGSYFDVFVILAVSPSNFVVQPLKTARQLTELSSEMQNFYNNEDNLCDMHSCLLKEKQYYAVLHSDKMWYRTQITKITSDDPIMAAVHFVDYGDYAVVEMNNLQPLYQQFKSLPCQAIKASLTGIKDDWTAEEGYSFKNLVQEKTFVSIIAGQKPNSASGQSTVLLSELIDTSRKDEDVHITKLLLAMAACDA